MDIVATRHGGYAGLHEMLTAHGVEHDSPLGLEVIGLLAGCEFFDLPAHLADEEVVYDGLHYTLRVVDGPRDHTVAYSDGAIPPDELAAVTAELVAYGHRWQPVPAPAPA
jgi:hypothetical protein